jgi:hypothetical protein
MDRFFPFVANELKFVVIADQSSALFSSDLCGECEMTMSDVGKKMAGRSFWGCREMDICTTTLPIIPKNKPRDKGIH